MSARYLRTPGPPTNFAVGIGVAIIVVFVAAVGIGVVVWRAFGPAIGMER